MSWDFSAASALFGLASGAALLTGGGNMDDAVPTLADLSFMAGCWEGQLGEDMKIRETFTPMGGSAMFGNSQIFGNTKTNFFEFIVLEETGEGVVYRPYPRGEAAAAFPLVSLADGEAVFENAENDYPQRIAYRLTGENNLVARIETIAGEKQQRFDMSAVPCGEEAYQRALSR